jgi:hypothetical protein
VRDRQYISSLATTVVGGSLWLGLLLTMLVWLGWKGLVGLLAFVGGFLLWFYRGPRPDLRPREGKPGGHRSHHD